MIESSLTQSDPVMLPDRSLGRVVRSIAGHALLAALLIGAKITVFVPAVLLHSGIRNGRRAAWATLAALLPLAALFLVVDAAGSKAGLGMVWADLAAVVLAIGLPTLFALPMVERGEKFGRVLVVLLIGSAIGLAATEIGSRAVLSFSPYAVLVEQVREMGSQLVELILPNRTPAQIAEGDKTMGYSLFVLPAFMVMNMAVVFLLSLLMLGRLKVWHDHSARRGDPEMPGALLFRNFALPEWMLFAFILGGLTPLASGMLQKVAANTLAVVVFLYIVQGLAVLRFVLSSMGAGFATSMLVCVLLVFLTFTGLVAPLMLGVTGLFDPFFDFRHFKNRKDDSDESHSD